MSRKRLGMQYRPQPSTHSERHYIRVCFEFPVCLATVYKAKFSHISCLYICRDDDAPLDLFHYEGQQPSKPYLYTASPLQDGEGQNPIRAAAALPALSINKVGFSGLDWRSRKGGICFQRTMAFLFTWSPVVVQGRKRPSSPDVFLAVICMLFFTTPVTQFSIVLHRDLMRNLSVFSYTGRTGW